ncbi:MAG: class I adenylate-forming enzyme family protein [bacterium]|nr:long-chain fatty acid--CoA ligase [Gammaproteobacteria bacterium]
MNIAMFLQMAAEVCADRSALTYEGRHYTYLELFDSAKKAAELFSNSDCQFISVLDVSSPAVPVALMGAAMAGIPYVPLNYRLSPGQLNELLVRIEPAYLVVDDGKIDDFKGAGAIVRGREDFLSSLESSASIEFTWAEDPSAVAIQLFTSGTTGAPKAAILRHEHLVSYILGTVEFMGAAEEHATLVAVPPYHIAGISAVMSSIYACRRIVQLPNFDPAVWLNLCANEKISNAFVVPTMLTRIIEEMEQSGFDTDSLNALEAIAYGGGKMPVPVIERALDLMPHINFTNAYGLTETSSTITLLDPDDHRHALENDDPAIRSRLGSVGKALPAVEIEIRDDDGNVLGPLEAGEIYVRGPQVSGEYLEKNALIEDGWFPTRDAGHLDNDNYLYLSGRADDVIVRGGENISPAEIEDVLHNHAAIGDVAAVGIPSEEWGEAVALAVVLKNNAVMTEDEIKSSLRAELRSSRVPEVIVFRSELPYTDTGKLLRRVVKTWFE